MSALALVAIHKRMVDLISVNRERLRDGDVIRHSASFLYSGANVSWLVS